MKKIYKLETNASTMFLTYDFDECIVRILDNEETNSNLSVLSVQDDSSWNMFNDVDLESFENDFLNNAEISEEYTFLDDLKAETIKKIIYEFEEKLNNGYFDIYAYNTALNTFTNTVKVFDYDFEIFRNNKNEITEIHVFKI